MSSSAAFGIPGLVQKMTTCENMRRIEVSGARVCKLVLGGIVHYGNDNERNQSVPHPNLLPQGEGTAGGQFSTIRPRGDANSASRRTRNRSLNPNTRTPKAGRALLPLPRGEGWGEGQTSAFATLALGELDAANALQTGSRRYSPDPD